MDIISIRALTMKYLEPFLTQHGFVVKLNKSNEAQIRRQEKEGFDSIGIDMLNYDPSYRIRYGFNKVNSLVSSIMLNLQEKVKLNFKEEKNSRLLFFSYNTINDPENTSYLPMMESETDVQTCVRMMIAFMEETAFPLLQKFEDLGEIDKMINGEDPWETDWHRPITFVTNFYEKRLIIAKLAGNPNFDELVDFNYKTLEKLSAENGSPFVYDRNDLSKPLPVLINILNETESLVKR